MTRWMRFCRMAWWRFDRWLEDRADDRAWRQNVHDRNEAFDSSWIEEIRPVEDFAGGLFDPTTRQHRRPRSQVQDLLDKHPFNQERQGRGRHRANPKEEA